MHYYKFNISDYKAHTEHLELLEDLAFRRMLDWMYLHEKPLPKNVNEIARFIRMRSHCDCIEYVLQEFFIKEKDGYYNARVEKELGNFQKKSDMAKKSAEARWKKKTNKNNDLDNANASKTQCEDNADGMLNTKHKTLNTKQETLNNIISCELEEIKDLYNATIDNEKANWSKIQELTTKRKNLIKNLISFAKKRIKQSEDQNEKPVKYLERLLSAMANDGFHSGKNPSTQYPNGYKWTFDQVAKQDNLIKFIERESA
jgi:uncharacterized protein YdaU (DUF1376 family)